MDADPRTDGELLAEFSGRRDEAAFEALLRRHGALVASVCRRILGNSADAEDAAQAAFLTLAHKAGGLAGRPSVAGWLHRVAWHIALRARKVAVQRAAREREAAAMAPANHDHTQEWVLLKPVLDQELDGLPEKYRLPLLLHYMEGHTKEETAVLMGCNPGTVSTWLDRGRELLKDRLARRGVTLSVLVLISLLSKEAAAAEGLAEAGIAGTAQAAVLAASGKAAAGGLVSSQAAALAKGALEAMFYARLKVAVLALVAVSLLGAFTGIWAFRTAAAEPRPAEGGAGKTAPAEAVRGGDTPAAPVAGPQKGPRRRTALAWDLEAAKAQLALSPRDPYLQYVAMQLGRRAKNDKLVADEVAKLINPDPVWVQQQRQQRVDLLNLFSGALAVQESLQLDTMRGEIRARGKGTDGTEGVKVANLTGPTIQSHPWDQMLAGRKPAVDALAYAIPEDFYYVVFRSPNKLVEANDLNDLWGTHFLNQAFDEARTQNAGERVKRQLAIETNPLLRPIYDLVVEQVALTGSDPFFREGSDVTIIFKAKQPALLKDRMDGFLANAAKARPDAVREEGEYLGVKYVALVTPDRGVSVYSAYPSPELHVRSNSKVALRRVLECIQGRGPDGQPVRRLSDAGELAYIRTLMPLGAAEEDGFVYLSDPFIRRLVGPQVKLTERRRVLCYNHLRMLGHASLMFRTEFGRAPESLQELAEADCTPGRFGQGTLVCPDGGNYQLAADGRSATCTVHGNTEFLTPCCELPLEEVSGLEADEYRTFVEQYNRYWRTYFDPIGVRVQMAPERYRLETIILPLIDNSAYTGLSMMLTGPVKPFDTLPVPARNIFSLALQTDTQRFLADMPREFTDLKWRNMPESIAELVQKGFGNQAALNVYDAPLTFDFSVLHLLGQEFGRTAGFGSVGRMDEALYISFILMSLNSPVYISVPVKDAKAVDGFLAQLDDFLAQEVREQQGPGWFRIGHDFTKLEERSGVTIRAASVNLERVVTWRFFWARIGDGFYIASKKFILDDLAALETERAKAGAPKPEPGPAAHGLVRIRASNWNQVLDDYRLGWAENNRKACLNNLTPLANAGRALAASRPDLFKTQGDAALPAALGAEAQRDAEAALAVRFFCPEGGRYQLSADGKTANCTVHGGLLTPRQPLAPSAGGPVGQLLKSFTGATVALSFLEDGLRAVVTVERK